MLWKVTRRVMHRRFTEWRNGFSNIGLWGTMDWEDYSGQYERIAQRLAEHLG
jgi:hypothetical protein